MSSFAELIYKYVSHNALGKEMKVSWEANLACNAALEQHGGVVVDELELFEDLDPLLVVGDKLEILIREYVLELGDVHFEDLLAMRERIL